MIDNYIKDVDAVAKAEILRVWDMRSQFPSVTEATIPILVQYGVTYSTVDKLSKSLNNEDYSPKWDANLKRLDKMQKILLSYIRILKLDNAEKQESKNKFASLLLNK